MIITPLHKLIGGHEGYRSKVYCCPAGKLTVGFGRNLEDLGITEQEAYMLLDNDIKRCVAEVKKRFPWYADLDSVRKDCVISMAYNLGITRMLEFKKTIQCLSIGDYNGAASEMLDSTWSKQVGPRATELAWMIKNGAYIVKP